MAKRFLKSEKIDSAQSTWDSETQLLAWLATCVSVISFLFYFKRGEVLLYGDAIAHINIARRVFDSRTPGLLQLGTVWLPLPHLLMIPFLISRDMWQRGAGGSIPSMVAYVFGVCGIFRLVRAWQSRDSAHEAASRFAAWSAAIVYAGNPNLIYMQATAMGEVLYLAFFIWTLVYLGDFLRGDRKALRKCGLCVAAGCLTRYDGWFLAVTIAGIVLLRALLPSKENASRPSLSQAVKFTLIAAAAPALWLAYNGIVYRNPLEFENGPYSAKAIERKTQAAGNPGHPGGEHPISAGQYFLKSAEANMAQNDWLQRTWILLLVSAIVGTAVLSLRQRDRWVTAGLVLLLLPIPFYGFSIAYGGVPIFIPPWWPFSHYNVRYGLQLLPAFAAAVAILSYLAVSSDRFDRRARLALAVGVGVLVIASYVSVWRAGPVCLEEAQVNMRTRTQLEAELAVWLDKSLPPDATLLMYLGDHVGALERAGIPLKYTINEGNHRVWKQPADPQGLWEHALGDPTRYADYVLAFEGDPVWQAVHGLQLREIVDIHVTGQSRAVLYRAR